MQCEDLAHSLFLSSVWRLRDPLKGPWEILPTAFDRDWPTLWTALSLPCRRYGGSSGFVFLWSRCQAVPVPFYAPCVWSSPSSVDSFHLALVKVGRHLLKTCDLWPPLQPTSFKKIGHLEMLGVCYCTLLKFCGCVQSFLIAPAPCWSWKWCGVLFFFVLYTMRWPFWLPVLVFSTLAGDFWPYQSSPGAPQASPVSHSPCAVMSFASLVTCLGENTL